LGGLLQQQLLFVVAIHVATFWIHVPYAIGSGDISSRSPLCDIDRTS
jgi:hypothetical protein